MEKINLAKLARDIRDCDLKGLDAMIEAKYPHGKARAVQSGE